jgi:C1q domain
MDKLRKTSNIPPTTLSASISDTDTTIPLSSTVGAETSTCIDIVIDRIDAAGEKTPDKMEVVTVLISGNNGTNAVRGRTAPAMPHEQGAVVEYNISTSVLHNDLIDGMSSILTLEGKPKEKSIPLDSINGGTKGGVLVVGEDGKTTVGKIKSENIDFTTMPMFSATTSKWEALPQNQSTIVKYDNVAYDTAKMYDTKTFTAKIPKDGIYHIDARTGIAQTGFFSQYTAYISIFKNGEMIKESAHTRGADNDRHLPRPSLSVDLLLKKNDVIDIRAFCSDQRNYGGDSTVSEFSMRFIGSI